jgi:ABC-type transporter Mla subunit MlaD
METETIDRLFLELSQFTRATTAKELKLRDALLQLADAADRVGVDHFDGDDLPPAVDLLNVKTRAAFALLKELA